MSLIVSMADTFLFGAETSLLSCHGKVVMRPAWTSVRMLFLHKAYLCAHEYKESILKYFKIEVADLLFYFPFYYLCKIE